MGLYLLKIYGIIQLVFGVNKISLCTHTHLVGREKAPSKPTQKPWGFTPNPTNWMQFDTVKQPKK
jgi:hypothetical protein